jgi:glycosyltransferase involved in cell wall biosynthesis
MPCRNAGPFLTQAITSVLNQHRLLELLIADAGSTDGSLEILQEWASRDRRVRIVSRQDKGPGDALNVAFKEARGSIIGWLNADDLYTPGCLARATDSLAKHPEWLMVYGEGEEFDDVSGFHRPYPTIHPSLGLKGLRDQCGICQPTVVWRRSMGVMLGPFSTIMRTAFDYDYWLRAFGAFPHRIGFIPHIQAFTRLHKLSITTLQRGQVAIETTQLQAATYGSASGRTLHNYGLELQSGRALLPPSQTLSSHMATCIKQASPYLSPHALAWLKETWCPNNDVLLLEENAASLKLQNCTSVQILQIAHPHLAITTPSPPAGPHRRLLAGIEQYWASSLLLQQDVQLHRRLPHFVSYSDQPTQAKIQKAANMRPFGVNLIGHAFNVFGLGEDIRMAALALNASSVPFVVIDVPATNGSAAIDRSLVGSIHPGPSGPYAFNLICLQPTSHAQWLLQNGKAAEESHYTIAAWPWETDIWPETWKPMLNHCDELWPPSSLINRALEPLAKHYNLPIHIMPMAVDTSGATEVEVAQTRSELRQRFNLPQEATIFVFSFDFNSTSIRKNPHGVIEAFQLAFPIGQKQDVALLIKILSSPPNSHDWQWLEARRNEDRRIKVIAADLERADLLKLYGCCDVFVSLHRSEGYGRNLAEALQMGLTVIATDYGGNTDFCQGALAYPVPFRMVTIPPDAYPPADLGHKWAEPDIQVAAAMMRQVAEVNCTKNVRSVETMATYRQIFNPHSVGKRYRTRLENVWELI